VQLLAYGMLPGKPESRNGVANDNAIYRRVSQRFGGAFHKEAMRRKCDHLLCAMIADGAGSSYQRAAGCNQIVHNESGGAFGFTDKEISGNLAGAAALFDKAAADRKSAGGLKRLPEKLRPLHATGIG